MANLEEEFKSEVSAMSQDDLPNDDLKDLAQVCGMETAIKLLKELNGIHIYIPKDGFKKVIDRFIIKNFNGTNAKKLAIICDISEVHVYEIIRKEDSKKAANRATKMQQHLFDQCPA